MNALIHDWRQTGLLLLALSGLGAARAFAELEVVQEPSPQAVFDGAGRTISVTFHNRGDQPATVETRRRLFQTTSATAVPVSEMAWKKIQAQPGQTIVESAVIDFPAVKAETPFLIQWLEGANRVLGTTEVLVYPTNLLAELKTLAGGEDLLGVFDPNLRIKPLLNALKIPFADLEQTGVAGFRGRLAVVGPFESKAQMPASLGAQVQTAAGKGVGVIWIQPPRDRHDKPQPSFSVVPENARNIVVAQADTIAGLADNPRAQFNLLHFARLALQPESSRLPPATQP